LKWPYSDIFGSLFNPERYVSKRLISQIPTINIADTDNELYIELAAPGLQKENFKNAVEMKQLTIIGERN